MTKTKTDTDPALTSSDRDAIAQWHQENAIKTVRFCVAEGNAQTLLISLVTDIFTRMSYDAMMRRQERVLGAVSMMSAQGLLTPRAVYEMQRAIMDATAFSVATLPDFRQVHAAND